jgi:hypothetical protein
MALNFFLKRTATASKRPVAASVSLGELNIDYDTNTFGLFAKNSAGTITKIGPVEVGTTAPNATPAGSAGNSRGELWYDSTNGLLKTYNGTAFVNPVPNGSTTVVGILQLTDSISSTSTTTAATPNSVKTAYDLANAAVPKSAVTAKGDLIVATASATVTALPVGTNGQVLVPNSSCTAGLEWITVGALCLTGYTCAATPFNTAIGTFAGDSITSGTGNTTVGYNAGTAIVGGGSNTLIGFCTGDAITGGAANTAVGTNALGSNLNGNSNVAIGALALSVSICDQNVAVGNGAGCTVTTGTQNVLVGYLAGATFTSAIGNTVVGWNSMPVATIGCTTAVGASALQALTVGQLNTAVGYNAGLSVVSNGNNAFFGACAGRLQTSANNTAVGTCALANTGVNNNTGIGYQAGAALTTGGSNTFVGAAAGDNATTADNAVAVGYNALGAAHTANGTVAIGVNALAANTSGACNTAVGFNAGTAVTVGSNNTMLGYAAGDTVTTGTQNTFLGSGSGGVAATTSEGNTGVGFSALGQGVLSGAYNVALGNNAGLSVTSGAINTLVGFSAGSAITTGGSNTLVGRYAGTATLANNVVLSDGAGTIRFQSNSSGAISLGAGGAYGTAGQILVSGGSGAAPAWTSSLPQVTAPTASTDAGVQGQIASDATYFYVYTGGRWQRVAWDVTVW